MPIFYDPINLATNQLEQARIENLGTDPGTGVSGQIYYNTVSNKLKFYDGSAWANIGGGSAANDFLTGLSFSTTNGVLTATVQNQSNVTVDLLALYISCLFPLISHWREIGMYKSLAILTSFDSSLLKSSLLISKYTSSLVFFVKYLVNLCNFFCSFDNV